MIEENNTEEARATGRGDQDRGANIITAMSAAASAATVGALSNHEPFQRSVITIVSGLVAAVAANTVNRFGLTDPLTRITGRVVRVIGERLNNLLPEDTIEAPTAPPELRDGELPPGFTIISPDELLRQNPHNIEPRGNPLETNNQPGSPEEANQEKDSEQRRRHSFTSRIEQEQNNTITRSNSCGV